MDHQDKVQDLKEKVRWDHSVEEQDHQESEEEKRGRQEWVEEREAQE